MTDTETGSPEDQDPTQRTEPVAPAAPVTNVDDRHAAESDRDAGQGRRDAAAADRDHAADDRDHDTVARRDAAIDRDRAGDDRGRGADDRLDAKHDRALADIDRDFAGFDRNQATLDRARHDDTPNAEQAWRDAAKRRDLAAELRDESATRRNGSAFARDEASVTRDRAATRRDRSATIRDAATDARDVDAEERDDGAASRDVAADRRDLDAIERDQRAETRERHADRSTVQAILADAATDRGFAQIDRTEAAMDRLEAAEERARLRALSATSPFDPVTGLLLQGPGLRQLRHELDAVDGPGRLCLALVAPHRRSRRSDDQGRTGDADLLLLADSIRAEIRGLDSVFCWEGDRLVVGFRDTSLGDVARRLDAAAGRIDAFDLDAGVAESRAGETAEHLIERAGDAMAPVDSQA
jgi:hypothetical protein